MSKWLGLGFVFEAKDDGVKNTFRGIGDEVGNLGEGLDDIDSKSKKSKKSMFSWNEILQTGFLAKINQNINRLSGSFSEAEESSRSFTALNKLTTEARGLGESVESVDKFLESFHRVSSAFGVDRGTLVDYVSGLRDAGFSFEDINRTIERSAESIGLLNQSASSAIAFEKMSKQLQLTDDQAAKLREQVLSVGLAAGDPRVLDSLDDLQKVVSDSTAFQGLVGEGAQKAVLDLVKTQLIARKALGQGQSESAAFVTGIFQKFKEAEMEFRAVRAGTSQDVKGFQDLSIALGDAGKALTLIESNDTMGFINSVQQSLSGLSGETRKNALFRLREIFGDDFVRFISSSFDDVGRAISNNLDNEKVIQQQRVINGVIESRNDQVKGFIENQKLSVDFLQRQLNMERERLQMGLLESGEADRVEVLRKMTEIQQNYNKALLEAPDDTFLGLIRQFKQLEQYESTQGKLLGFLKIFKVESMLSGGALDVLSGTMDFLTNNIIELAFALQIASKAKGVFSKGAEVAVKTGSKLMGFFSKVGNVVSRIITPITTAASRFGGLQRAFGFFAKAGSHLGMFGNTLKALGGVLGKIAIPIGVLISLISSLQSNWDGLTSAFKDGDFVGVLQMTGKILWDTINNFFLGIPGAIAGLIDGVISSMVHVFKGGAFGDIGKVFRQQMAGWMKDIPFVGDKIYRSMMSGNEDDSIEEFSKEAKESGIEARRAPVVQTSGDSIVNNNQRSSVFNKSEDGIDSSEISKGLVSALAGMGLSLRIDLNDGNSRRTVTRQAKFVATGNQAALAGGAN